jgi:hypothetical protein
VCVPGRADLNAGAAELAAALGVSLRNRADNNFAIFYSEAERLDSTQVPAGANAAGAANAEIVVPLKQRLIPDFRQPLGLVPGQVFGNANEVGDLLQFAVAQLGAAAFFLRHVERALSPAAPLLLRAHQARVWVPEKYLAEIALALLLDAVAVCDNHHTVGDLRIAGSYELVLPLDFDEAEAAALVLFAFLSLVAVLAVVDGAY